MALTNKDFTKGLDFTALGASATAADHNNLVDLGVPFDDGGGTGKGLILVTKDTALDTPNVPDPNGGASFLKWKRYYWCRIPHSTATSLIPINYAWNDNAVSDVTLLKWLSTATDLTAVLAAIASVSAIANTALTIANNATTTANAANTNANTALTNSNTAVTTANTAAANATTAIAIAASASADAVSASSAAATALAAANAQHAVPAALTPGLSLQVVRTNAGATAAEWAYNGIVQRSCKLTVGGLSTVAAIPVDNTIPQVGEGLEFTNISFTPKSAASLLRITFTSMCDTSGAGDFLTIALFKDGGADALCAVGVNCSDLVRHISLDYVIAAGSVVPQIFSLRFGPDAGSGYLNRNGAGQVYSTAGVCSFIIEEFVGTFV